MGTHVNTTLSVLRALDLDRVHGLLETRLGKESRGVADSSADGDELSSTSVDGVGVKGDIHLRAVKKVKVSVRFKSYVSKA